MIMPVTAVKHSTQAVHNTLAGVSSADDEPTYKFNLAGESFFLFSCLSFE
jgi:hypothetical protein